MPKDIPARALPRVHGHVTDYTGFRQGKLVFLHIAGKDGKQLMWAYRCDCGTEGTTRAFTIYQGKDSCGCKKRVVTVPSSKLRDFTGHKQGSLTVIRRGPKYRNGHNTWVCQCECGNVTNVAAATLVSGGEKCGKCAARTHGATTGNTISLTYRSWGSMKRRCYNTKAHDYVDYGGRGIYICEGWMDDYAVFLADVGERPSQKHSIDRWNNEGSYTCGKCDDCIARGAPANCKWSTNSEQGQRKRTSVMIVHDGETLNASQWALRFNPDNHNKERNWAYVQVRMGRTDAQIIEGFKRRAEQYRLRKLRGYPPLEKYQRIDSNGSPSHRHVTSQKRHSATSAT